MQNPDEPYTNKYQNHVGHFGYNLVCVDDHLPILLSHI